MQSLDDQKEPLIETVTVHISSLGSISTSIECSSVGVEAELRGDTGNSTGARQRGQSE